MYLEGIGGIKVFSTELHKEEKKLVVIYHFMNELGSVVNEEKLIINIDENFNIIDFDSRHLNKLLKKQLISVFNNYVDNSIIVPAVKNVKFNLDYTDIEFELTKQKHKISINWNETYDFMSQIAPNSIGEYYIDSRINNEVLKQYLAYAYEGSNEQAEVVSKINFLLFFENIDQQRSFHQIQILSGISALTDMFSGNENDLFENIEVYEKKQISNGNLLAVLKNKVEKYTFTLDMDLNLEIDKNVFSIISNGIVKEKELFSLLYFLNENKYNNKYKIYKYNPKNTNKKSLLNSILIEEKGSDSNLYSYKIEDYSGFITNGRNLEIDYETLEFLNIYNPEQISIKVIENIFNLIDFMEKNK